MDPMCMHDPVFCRAMEEIQKIRQKHILHGYEIRTELDVLDQCIRIADKRHVELVNQLVNEKLREGFRTMWPVPKEEKES